MTTRTACATAVTILLAACGGPDPASFEDDVVDAPFEGTWRAGGALEKGTFYRIAITGDRGLLTVETDGQVTNSYSFRRDGDWAIDLDGIERDAHALGPMIETKKLIEIIQFTEPPGRLTFTTEGPPVQYAREDQDIVYISDLMQNFPIPVPLLRIRNGERVELPFRPVSGDVDLTVGDVLARGAVEGGGMMDMTFLEPQHPEGEFRSLNIAGHDIALASTKLEDGMLHTRDFGDLEILETGSGRGGGTRIHATLDQIRAIRSWLDAQGSVDADKQP